MAQFGVGLHPGRTSLLAPVGALLVTACGGGLVVAVLGQLVPRTQRAVRSRIAKRRKLRTAASAEVRARAMMDELCPYGWRAQITMFGAHEVPPSSSSGRRPDRVEFRRDLVEDLEHAFEGVRAAIGGVQLAIGCDCILRKLEIAQRGLVDRVEAVFRENNVIGFNSYGEQYRGVHVNQTLTGIAIGALTGG